MAVILALDVGEKRIGVAASDPLEILASPVETLARNRDADAVRAILDLAAARNAERIVVGLPKTLRNEIGHQAEKALAFVEKLKAQSPIPIDLWDERLTTTEAHRRLRAPEDPSRRRPTTKKHQRRVKETVDQAAAAILLESYLAARASSRS